jgi:hypothetical protein
MGAALGPNAIKAGDKLIGEGGAYGSQPEAEAAYRTYTKVIQSRGKAPTTPAAPADPAKPADPAAPAATPNTEAQPLAIGKPTANPEAEPEDVVGIVAKSGLKMEDLVKSFTDTGDLTEDQYTALRGVRKNLGKSDIKLIAEGWAAKATALSMQRTAIKAKLSASAGSEAQMQTILNDVGALLSPQEIATYTPLLDNSLTAESTFALLTQIRKDRMGAGGSGNQIIPKSSSPSSGISPLRDRTAILSATRDERFAPSINGSPNPKHDPTYYQQVLQAIEAGKRS